MTSAGGGCSSRSAGKSGVGELANFSVAAERRLDRVEQHLPALPLRHACRKISAPKSAAARANLRSSPENSPDCLSNNSITT